MVKTEMTERHIFETAKHAYERSRIKLALGAALVVAVVPLLSTIVGGHQLSGLTLGVSLISGVGVLIWRGGAAALGAMSGLKAGLVPLAFAHAAQLYGHVCIPGQGCTTLCVPACAVGGLMAGMLVERFARQSSRPNIVRGGGAVVAFLTGALGCSCVGSFGMLGLLGGMALTLLGGRLIKQR